MPINPNLALVPMQGVQAQGSAIDKMFNTYYKSAGNARQNALFDLQKQNTEFSQGLQVDANNRANESHALTIEAGEFKIDQAQGEKIYRAFEGFDKLAPETRQAQIDFMMPELSKFGFDAEDVDMLMNDPQQAMAIMERFKPIATDSATRNFNAMTNGMSAEDIDKARRIELGLDSRAGTLTGDERLGNDPSMTTKVANSQAAIEGAKSGAKETAKLDAQAELLPQIRADIKAAEVEATGKGESLSSYKKATAALPGLKEVVGRLKSLSDMATYTYGGRAFDEVVKQLGFGSTEGGTARVQMRSIVDNQVLPLLRETFGAAFTKAEGDSLRETMLDLDSTPEAKKATLDAFIEQKMRTLETQERELSVNDELLEFMSPEEQALFQ